MSKRIVSLRVISKIVATLLAAMSISKAVLAADHTGGGSGQNSLLVKARYIFDGEQFVPGAGKAILVQNGRIVQVGSAAAIIPPYGARVIDIPDGTILPGFIDMHSNYIANKIPVIRILEHGVTTIRDLGGPLTPVDTGKPFKLRQILSGPIITAKGGYPMPVFPKYGVEVTGVPAAINKVRELVSNGAKVIAVSLEPGGEQGAPWTTRNSTTPPPWPMLTPAELTAIVNEAHRLNKPVVAYLGESTGVLRALDAGIDEWAHIPCDHVDHPLWDRISIRDTAISPTLDALASCTFADHNTGHAVEVGASVVYGTSMGLTEIPHGVDAQEIYQLASARVDHGRKTWPQAMALALNSATGAAGKYLFAKRETNEPSLGRLVAGAPADLIVIGGNPIDNYKDLEYPRLVVSGGHVVIERSLAQ